jgi:predicted MFS family arabinose efflux permease
VFYIAVPFGLVGTVLGWLVLPCTSGEAASGTAHERARFDWLGAVLLGPGVALVLLGLTYGNTWGWTSPGLALTWLGALVCLVTFWIAESRSLSPLIDPLLLRVQSFSLGLVAGLLSYAVLFGSLFVMPFYLERIVGQTPAQTGLLLTPIPIALGLLAPIAGTLTDRIGPVAPTVAGMASAALALAGLALIPGASLGATLGLLALLGIGLGLFTPPNNAAVMGSAAADQLGVAGGILNMTRSLGTSLGVAATGAVLVVRLSARLGSQAARTLDAPPITLLPAFHETLLFLAGRAVVAGLLSTVRRRTK